MRDILPAIDAWGKEPFALAIVVQTWGSSPRPVGSMMAVSQSGRVAGSVSGGCVEGAVIETAAEVLRTGNARELEFSELDPEDVWAVGLSCGGRIQVLVVPGDNPALVAARESSAKRVPFGLKVDGTQVALDPNGNLQYPAPERLLIIGGGHIAIPLIAFAKELGFETFLIEPRAQFADLSRFPSPPDRVYAMWPSQIFEAGHDASLPSLPIGIDSSTYAVLLTHDPKIDDQALHHLLRSPAAYIGCLGSRTTHAQRRERLQKEGFTEEEIARIHGPVGLAIGAKTPAEIAVSILAEMIEVRRGR